MSSKVFAEKQWSGKMNRGILSLPFLPVRPGRLILVMFADSVLS
jgi:hypothetical protein